MLAPYLGVAIASYAEIAVGVVVIALIDIRVLWALGKSIARPLADAADTFDAMAYAELGSAPPLATNRSEIARLLAATDRLAEVHRRAPAPRTRA